MANEFIIKNGAIIRPGGTLEIGDSTDTGFILPETDGVSGQALVTDGAGNVDWGAVSGTPGGTNTQIQYNNGGAFGGDTGFITDGAGNVDITGSLDVDSINIDGIAIESDNGGGIVFSATAGPIILSSSSTSEVYVYGALANTPIITAPNGIDTNDVDESSLIVKSGDFDGNDIASPTIYIEGGEETTAGFPGGNVEITGGAGSVTGDVVIQGLTYPATDGSNGEVLTTDGAGNLTFAAPELDDLSDVTVTSPAVEEVLQYNGSQWVNAAVPSATTVERLRVVYNGFGQISSIDNISSGINSATNTGTTVDVSFTGYDYPPASIIKYGYDATNTRYEVRHLIEGSSPYYMDANGGAIFGSLTTSEEIHIGMALNDTGAENSQHAWLVFIFGG